MSRESRSVQGLSQAVTWRGWRVSGISVSECVSARHDTRERRDRRRELRRSPPPAHSPLSLHKHSTHAYSTVYYTV